MGSLLIVTLGAPVDRFFFSFTAPGSFPVSWTSTGYSFPVEKGRQIGGMRWVEICLTLTLSLGLEGLLEGDLEDSLSTTSGRADVDDAFERVGGASVVGELNSHSLILIVLSK